MRNWFDLIDVLISQGGVDISSLLFTEGENDANKVMVRKMSKEEIENATFDEYEDVTYERINQ